MRRQRVRSRRSVGPLGVAIRVAAYGFWASCFVISAVFGVVSVMDQDEPVVWGTFTTVGECENSLRGGPHCTGDWVSDDGTIIMLSVDLDGYPEYDDGTARAGYRPTAILHDEEVRVVHTATWINSGWWVSGMLCIMSAGFAVGTARSWGDLRWLARRRAAVVRAG